MTNAQRDISIGDIIATAHACVTDSLLKLLSDDLQHQLARADAACSQDELVMAEGAMAYIRELCGKLGPRVLN
jgi:hypothetical protein